MKLPKTVKLYFSNGDQEECLVRVDGSGEVVCYARDGRFAKFSAADEDEFKAAVKAHNAANKDVPVLAEEADDGNDDELAAWLAGDGDDEDDEAPAVDEISDGNDESAAVAADE